MQNNWLAAAEREKNVSDSGGDLDDWANIIRDLRTGAGLGYVGLLLHWYGGPLSERIDATRKKLQFDEHLRAGLGAIEEDVLYIVS